MRNDYFFQLNVTAEQLRTANDLVDYSLVHHPVKDIFVNDPNGKARQREFRLTGTLGEIVFADTYALPRPKRSFGAVDGQDYGQDFVMDINGHKQSFDLKSMRRKDNHFKRNYVLNLPEYQLLKSSTVTDYYFCISFHSNEQGQDIASFIGYVAKAAILEKRIGILYPRGTERIKDNKESFTFQRNTYEVFFEDLSAPFLNETIMMKEGFLRSVLQ